MTKRTDTQHDDRPLLAVSPSEAARITGLGRTSIYAAIKEGDLKSIKLGRRRLIRIVALENWLQAHEVSRG